MKYLSICITAIIMVSCGQTQKKNQTQENNETKISVKLEMLWETDTLLQTPESVLVDEMRGILYVSNMNSSAASNSANGYISKVDMDGKIVELKWAEGLNGPKGMGLFGNNLFVSDYDELVTINIESGKIVDKIKIEGNPGLNDVTVGNDGSVYVAGFSSNVIYKVKNGVVELVFNGTQEDNFNGLLWEKDRMLLTTSSSSKFQSIDWKTSEVTVLAEGMGHGDGIAPIGNGDYITTDWFGRIFYIPAKGEKITLLDTREQEINTADISYNIGKKTLYVPTFYKNTIRAYKVIFE
jgi:hypothetical protein